MTNYLVEIHGTTDIKHDSKPLLSLHNKSYFAIYDTSMLSSLYTKYPPGGVVNVKQKVHPTRILVWTDVSPDDLVVCIALPTKSLKL